MQKLKFISIIAIFSLISFSFCLADTSESATPEQMKINIINSISGFWNQTGKPAWDDLVKWFDKDLRPWLEEQTSPSTKEEFNKESKEIINDIPGTLKTVWSKVSDLINKKD